MLFMSCAFAVFDYTIKNVTVSKKKMTQESKLITRVISYPNAITQTLKFCHPATVISSRDNNVKEFPVSRALFAVVLAFPLIALANPHYRPDVEVNVPPEVFSSGGQSAQPCTQCCVYQDQNYSEGAVIKAEGILLQCQRDDKTLSTNPLVWRRVKP